MPRDFRELDEFVQELVAKNKVLEAHRAKAVFRFRAAVVLAARKARAYEQSEPSSNEAIYEARDIAKRLAAIKPSRAISAAFPESVSELWRVQRHFGELGTLPVTNWRDTDVFRFAFINNLIVYWRFLTGQRPPTQHGTKLGAAYAIDFGKRSMMLRALCI